VTIACWTLLQSVQNPLGLPDLLRLQLPGHRRPVKSGIDCVLHNDFFLDDERLKTFTLR
jgi:hypothetical protein